MEYGSWREGDEEGLRLEKRNIACKIEQKAHRRPQRRRAHVDGGSAAGVFLDRCRRAAALPSALGAAPTAVPASFTCCEDPAISGCAAAGLASPCGIMAGMKKLAIIGGGAAGLAAAVESVRALRARGVAPGSVETTVYEASDRVGRSILATGNGRCNFSNACIDVAAYRNPTFVSQALAELEADPEPELESHEDPVHNLFADLGLLWREEGEGRLYPLANKATSVLDVLRSAAQDAGVHLACGCVAKRVEAPQRAGDRFHIRFADGAVQHADAVIVAVGGRAIEEIELPEGLSCASGRPVLGPLRTDTALVKPLNNVRVRCCVSLVGADGAEKARESGEVLFRDYAADYVEKRRKANNEPIQQTTKEKYQQYLRDYLNPVLGNKPIAPEKAEGLLLDRAARLRLAGRPCSADALVRGMLLPAVAHAVLKEAGLRPEDPFAKKDASKLARVLKGLPLVVRGIGDARQCQVTRGGLAVDAFDPRTMGARRIPGFFAVGEALDVDAPCGGYNLHWAWASGMLAARAAANELAVDAGRAKGAGRA